MCFRFLCIRRLLVAGLFFFAPFSVYAQKKALIIAISDYPATGGWPATHADNDLSLVEKAFKRQQFSVQMLSNQKATASGIREALASLYENAKAGEIIILHYSGHGQQLVDTNGDEADGLDEAIVPYDAPKNVSQNAYKGEKHILDDELGMWVGKMKQRLGKSGQLFVLLDCCYSGTGTRAGAQSISRSAPPIVPESFVPRSGIEANFLSSDINSATRSSANNPTASFVLFTGSSAPQQNYEVKGADGLFYGALSYALAESLENLSTTETYRTLFKKTAESITRRTVTQTPTSEGDLETVLFGGKFTASSSGFAVITDGVEKLQKTVRIAAGYLNGISTNTLIGFWNSGSARGEGKSAVINGKVTRVELAYSEVELEKPLTKEQLAGLEASGYLQLWQGNSFTVFVEDAKKVAASKIKEALNEQHIRTTNEPAKSDLIIKVVNNTAYLLRPDSYQLLDSTSNTSAVNLIQKYAYANFLRGLEVKSEPKAAIKLTNENQENSDNKNLLEVKANSKVQLQIQNTGSSAFYVYVQDIQPNAIVSTLLPNTSKGYNEIRIKPGEIQEFPITITPPFGLETFKVILTSQSVPLSNVASRSTSVLAHPLQRLLDGTKSRNTTASLPETSIYAIFFSIVADYTAILKK